MTSSVCSFPSGRPDVRPKAKRVPSALRTESPDQPPVGSGTEATSLPLASGSADVVVAVETIEHLENPRAFMRELVRLTKSGGAVIVTTPNQLSLLSKMKLVLKNRFNAFQDIRPTSPRCWKSI